ncbi:phosphoglucosamine mutase, partial [Bacteroidota bacterium]
MTLIKSISGIRGTIGGKPGEGLTPLDICKFTAAYGTWVKRKTNKNSPVIILGRDARISGPILEKIASGTLSGLGIHVINLGLSSTPTVEVAVTEENADGGIVLTASHNPKEWNALKFLNDKGEFINEIDAKTILELVNNEDYLFENVDQLGSIKELEEYEEFHINKILDLPLVDIESIAEADFTIAIDCVNSVGGIVVPKLLKKLGIKTIIELYCEPNGIFPHNPEPLPEHLTDLTRAVVENKASLGFVVDPDVDRLAIINEDGSIFGEEYTLVSVADYVLQYTPGNTVSNLSSSRALKEITLAKGYEYRASAVGEVNVVKKMKEINAVIGGEGNGGVIYPSIHYGR